MGREMKNAALKKIKDKIQPPPPPPPPEVKVTEATEAMSILPVLQRNASDSQKFIM